MCLPAGPCEPTPLAEAPRRAESFERKRERETAGGAAAEGGGRFFLYILRRNATFSYKGLQNVWFRRSLSPLYTKIYHFYMKNTALGPSPWFLSKTLKCATSRSPHRPRVIPQPSRSLKSLHGQGYCFTVPNQRSSHTCLGPSLKWPMLRPERCDNR